MKRHLAIREFIKLLNDDDIIVASGKTICSEAYQFDRPLLFYFDDVSISQTVALGMANGTEKRIFVFCSSDVLQNDLDFTLQLGLSKKSNIYYVVFDNNNKINLINGVRSLVGVLYNLGIEVYKYTKYFSKVVDVSKVKGHVAVLKGPAIILINTKPSNIEVDYIGTDYTAIKDTINGRDSSKK